MTKTVSMRSATSRSKKSKPRRRNVAARQTAPKATNRKAKMQPPIDASKSVGKPRADTKQAGVIAMLQASAGATIATMAGATGWRSHSVRGFLAALLVKSSASTSSLKRVTRVASTGSKMTVRHLLAHPTQTTPRDADGKVWIKGPQA